MNDHPANHSPVAVRLGTRDDVAAVVRLLADDVLGAQRERVEDPVAQVYLAAFDEMTAQAGNHLLVAERDGAVVGVLQFTIIPGLSRAGMRRAQIEGVRVSSRFYERLGFEATHIGMKMPLVYS